MSNLFYSSDFDGMLERPDIHIPSKIEKADLSILVYFRELHQDWLSFILHMLSLGEISLEIILINDGCPVNINLPQDERISLISNPETRGESICLKNALKKSKGQYIKWITFPDMLSSPGLVKQVDQLKSNKRKKICLGSAVLTMGEETKELKAGSLQELSLNIETDIYFSLIYKTAVFDKNWLASLIERKYLPDDLYDDCMISLAGLNTKNEIWGVKDVSIIGDTICLLNENPTLHDFLNVRRMSFFSKGALISEYIQKVVLVKSQNKKIKLAILDNNLNLGGAQWSSLQWTRLLPNIFDVKFLLYSKGEMVPMAINNGLNVEIWDRQASFEEWVCQKIKDWEADIIDVVWNGELLTESIVSTAPVIVAHLQSQEVPWLDNLMAKKQASRIDHFISVSSSIQEKYSKLADRIMTINSPVNASEYLSSDGKRNTMRKMLGIEENELAVGWCGRILSPEKRADLLREVVEAVDKQETPVRFVISGVIDGNLRDRDMYLLGWEKWCEDHGVSFISGFKPWEMILFHSAIDVFLSLSDTEGLSLATLEALAAGRPVISTDVGGQAEAVIPGVTGALIEKGSAEQAIKTVLEFSQAFRSEENKRALDLMGYLGQSLIGSECNVEHIMRQHAVSYITWTNDEHH